MTSNKKARPGAVVAELDTRITWTHVAEPGTTLQDCLEPTYWANNLRQLGQQRVVGRHAWNTVTILAEDGSWEAMLRVVGMVPNGAKVRLMWSWRDPDSASKPLPEGYRIEYVPMNGWRAIDPAGHIIGDKLEVEDAAYRAVEDNVAAMGGRRRKGAA